MLISLSIILVIEVQTQVEAAAFGGVAHLTCFKGTDNLNCLRYVHIFMNQPIKDIAFSVLASEHSTTTSWGKDREFDMVDNHLEKGKANPLLAAVADSMMFIILLTE